jgi:hypothetical protein
MSTIFYGILVQINGTWVKRLVVGVPVEEQHDGLKRLLKALHRLQEYANCPWKEARIVRIEPKNESNLQEWRETVRGRFMVIDLTSFEAAIHVLFGLA